MIAPLMEVAFLNSVKETEKYRDLMVEVAGYNAFFVRLTKTLQGGIIARTEHGL